MSRTCARNNGQDIGNILGALYLAVLFLGIINSRTVQPPCAYERTVMYRERAAGMCASAVLSAILCLSSLLSQLLHSSPIAFAWSPYCLCGAVRHRYNELPFALAQCVIVSFITPYCLRVFAPMGSHDTVASTATHDAKPFVTLLQELPYNLLQAVLFSCIAYWVG